MSNLIFLQYIFCTDHKVSSSPNSLTAICSPPSAKQTSEMDNFFPEALFFTQNLKAKYILMFGDGRKTEIVFDPKDIHFNPFTKVLHV